MGIKEFKELCEGWGIDVIDPQIRNPEMGCVNCGRTKGKLYTTESQVPRSSTIKSWMKMIDDVRIKTYCRTHIIIWWG